MVHHGASWILATAPKDKGPASAIDPKAAHCLGCPCCFSSTTKKQLINTNKSMINTEIGQGNSGDMRRFRNKAMLCEMSFSKYTLLSARPRPALSHDGIAAVHLLRRICWWFSGYCERGHRTIGPRMLQRVLKMQIAPEFPASVALVGDLEIWLVQMRVIWYLRMLWGF